MIDLLSQDLSKRLQCMSFICSVFVLLIHVWEPLEPGSFAGWVYALLGMREVAVPCFFIISGYLIAGHSDEPFWWKHELYKRVGSILIPYVLWSFFWLVYLSFRKLVALYCFQIPFSMFQMKAFLGFDPFSHPQLSPLWYLRTLMLFVLECWFLIRLIRLRYCFLGIAPLLLVLYLINIGSSYFFYDFCGLGWLFFFLFGAWLRINKINVTPKLRHPALLYILGFLMLAACHFIRLSGWTSILVLNIIFKSTMIVWVFLLWFLTSYISIPKWLYGKAFPIYLIHWFVFDAFNIVFYTQYRTISAGLFRFFFVLLSSVILAWVSCNTCKNRRLLKYVFGGR